jgi:hypothetical protein
MRIILLLLLFPYHHGFGDVASQPKVMGEWSGVTNGLRGRLVLTEDIKSERGLRKGIVYLELQNVAPGDTMYIYYDPKKDPVHCVLHDADGKAMRETPSAISSWIPSPCWLALPNDSILRFRTGNTSTEPNEPGLFIISAYMRGSWFVQANATNDYYLSGTFTAKLPTNEGRPKTWEGTLSLPKLKVPLKGP